MMKIKIRAHSLKHYRYHYETSKFFLNYYCSDEYSVFRHSFSHLLLSEWIKVANNE